MNRGEFKRRVDALTKPSAAQQAVNVLQGRGLVSVVKGTAFRPFTREEMAWIIFIASEACGPCSFQGAFKIAEENPEIIPPIALALAMGCSVEVHWFKGAGCGIRCKLSLSADVIKCLAGLSEKVPA